MCGIVAYVGKRRAAPVLIEGLKKLEYRGYDSAGIAVMDAPALHVLKRTGPVSNLAVGEAFEGRAGIGHTRWATHGAATEANAHPHVYGRFAVVHNGIIENAEELKEECLARGEKFSSETDSEIVAHLLDRYYRGDFEEAMRETAERLEGSYALAALCTEEPDTVLLAKRASPLIVGRAKEGLIAASDIPAAAEKGAEIYALSDGQFASMKGEKLRIFGPDGASLTLPPLEFDAEEDLPVKGGFRHYMRKEMAEIPLAIAKTLENFTQTMRNSTFREVLCQTEYVQIVACGTAFHSGLCAAYAIERLAGVRATAEIASEYRYRDPIVPARTLVLAVSQSGETADTLAAARLAGERGATVAAVTNTRYSSLARLASFVLATEAGREIAVAATKSFNAQLALLYALAFALAREKGREVDAGILGALPALAVRALEGAETVRSWTPHFLGGKPVFFLGRGADYCVAREGSLKLKEVSYLAGEGYAAGELKHGTLALIERGTPVVAVLTSKRLAEKTMNAVHETYARGAKVFLVTSLPEYADRKEVSYSAVVPDCGEIVSPAISSIPLQALAYYVSVARGNDPDKPRNLAKSVTVE